MQEPEALRVYDFGNATVLLTHPSINMRQTVIGCLTGTWTARAASRAEFKIVAVNAMLVLPHLDVQLPGAKAPERIHPGHVSLILGGFEVPAPWNEVFGPINHGKVNAKSRLYSAVLGMYAQFSFAHRADAGGMGGHMMLDLDPAPIVLNTFGTILDGGAMVAGGSGTVVGGWMQGAVIAASRCDPPPLPAPVKCRVSDPTGSAYCGLPKGHPLDSDGKGHANPATGETW